MWRSSRPPRHRPDGVRVVRRPQPVRAGGVGHDRLRDDPAMSLCACRSAAARSRSRPSTRPRVEIELVPLRDNDVTRQAIDEARVEMTRPRRRPRGGRRAEAQVLGFLVGRGPRVGVHVRCPAGATSTSASGSADLEVTGPLGAVEVKTASGDVALDDARLARPSTRRAATARRDVDGTVSMSGPPRVTCRSVAAAGRCPPISSPATSSVDEAARRADVTTVSGDVDVRAAGGGGMRVQAVSGDVASRHQARRAALHRRQLVSGTMSSELGLEDAPPTDSAGPSASFGCARSAAT